MMLLGWLLLRAGPYPELGAPILLSMSTRAKAFFGINVATAIVVIPWVHYVQQEQREVLHEGPIRDAARRSRKAAELTPQQQERAVEYEEQKRLRAELSETQKVSER